LGKGVLYKYNATTESKSQNKKFNATTQLDGKVQHASATTIYDNYPMETEQTKTFSAIWSNGWRGDGVKLDVGVWNHNVLVASTTNYMGMWGFNKADIQAWLKPNTDFGGVTRAWLYVNCYETTTNGSPDVLIGKHSYSSEPAGTWNGQNTDYGNNASLHVPNQALGGYVVALPTQFMTLADRRTAIGGVAMKGATAEAENHGKFNGYNTYNVRLEVTVLK
jgi:hypothetical protein